MTYRQEEAQRAKRDFQAAIADIRTRLGRMEAETGFSADAGSIETAIQWIEIQPYGKEGYKWWISGIYKIVSYGEGEYSAFYILDGKKNWGDYVSPPPHNGKYGKIWNSLEAAMKACSKHATSHSPKPSTQQRAAFLKQHFVNQANERGAA